MASVFRDLRSAFVQPLSWLYYRVAYLRTGIIPNLLQSVYSGPRRIEKETWEKEYGEGIWNRLSDIAEQPHYAVLLSYALAIREKPSVLDIGCGSGWFHGRLQPYGYRHYLGVDLSEVAIASCQARTDYNTEFAAADCETYLPSRKFDVIVFAESLYYFTDPIATVRRYGQYLEDGGLIVVSLFRFPRTEAIYRLLTDIFVVVDSSRLRNRKGEWYCFALGLKNSGSYTADNQDAGRIASR